MRNQARVIEKEGAILVVLDELQSLVSNVIGSVVLTLELIIASGIVRVSTVRKADMPGNRRIVLEGIFLIIIPQRRRIVGMCVGLAVVAKELFEPLLIRISFRPDIAQPLFSESSADVALFLQQLSDRNFVFRNRMLSLRLHRAVVADDHLTGVLTGHQDTT